MTTRQKENSFKDLPPEMDNRCNPSKTKFETFGEEMLEKVVKQNGYSCQIYLPPSWVGKQVKIIRIN